MGILGEFGTKKELEETGAWVSYSPNSDGTIPRVCIGRMGGKNKRWQAAYRKYLKPMEKDVQKGRLSNDGEAEDSLIMAFYEGCVFGWENIEYPEGEKTSIEDAPKVLKAVPDFYHDLRERSMDLRTFQETKLEEDAKN